MIGLLTKPDALGEQYVVQTIERPESCANKTSQ